MAMDINTLYAKADAAFEKQEAAQIQFGNFSTIAYNVKKQSFRAGYIACYIESMKPANVKPVTPWRAKQCS